MKKIIIAFILLLAGCSANKEPSIVPKKDPDKDYIYATKGDDLNLKDILHNQERDKDFDLIISNFESETIKNLEEKSFFDFEIIHLKIDTPDATEIEKKLAENNEQVQDLRSHAKSEIERNTNSFNWSSKILFDKFENDDFISFITLNHTFNYPGHASMKIDLISIDKSSGAYLSNSQRIERNNITLDALIETIKTDFKDTSYVEDNQTFNRKINEEIPEVPEENVKYFKLPDTDSIIVHNEKITLVLYEYSKLDGDFTVPVLYTIKINE